MEKLVKRKKVTRSKKTENERAAEQLHKKITALTNGIQKDGLGVFLMIDYGNGQLRHINNLSLHDMANMINFMRGCDDTKKAFMMADVMSLLP